MKLDQNQIISNEIISLFGETFGKLSSHDVSRKRGPSKETIASHVYHIIFYIKVLQEYITGVRSGKTDWIEESGTLNAAF